MPIGAGFVSSGPSSPFSVLDDRLIAPPVWHVLSQGSGGLEVEDCGLLCVSRRAFRQAMMREAAGVCL